MKNGREKKCRVKPKPTQRIYRKTVNNVIRFLAAEASEIAVKNRAEIAKEWLLWEVAGKIAAKFGASRKVRVLLKDPAREYANPRNHQENPPDNY